MRAFDVMAMYASLARSDNVTYLLSNELRLVDMNAAWDRFATENGSEGSLAHWQRGASVLEAVPAELEAFYRDGFARAARTLEHWAHDYECSSPTQFRKFRMLVYPFSEGFVVTHALLVSRPHEPGSAPSWEYERDGLISMCGHCRRVRHAVVRDRWDWVPAYVETRRDNISHGLCPACYGYYYDV